MFIDQVVTVDSLYLCSWKDIQFSTPIKKVDKFFTQKGYVWIRLDTFCILRDMELCIFPYLFHISQDTFFQVFSIQNISCEIWNRYGKIHNSISLSIQNVSRRI